MPLTKVDAQLLNGAINADSSGNVGIGTTSPPVVASGKTVQISASGRPRLYTTTTGSNAVNTFFGSSDDLACGQIDVATNHPLVVYTNDTERMRVTSSGFVYIGDSAAPSGAGSTTFYVKQPLGDYSAFFASSNATGGNCYGPYIKYTAAAPNGTGNNFLECADSSAVRAYFRSNGGLSNYSGNNTNLSDEREKTNIEFAGDYLEKICAIPVKTFNYIDQNREDDDGLTLGVIAQDVQKIAPELVIESNWANKDEPEKMRLSVYQTDLTFALMKSIQELKAELDATKAEVAALKAKP